MNAADTTTAAGLPQYYTPAEVAAALKVSGRKVRALLETGELRGTKVGSLWRVSPEAVREFLAAGTQAPDPEPAAPDLSGDAARRVLRAVCESPRPLKKVAIAKRSGVGGSYLDAVMTGLRKAGLIDLAPGEKGLWVPGPKAGGGKAA